MGYRATRRLGQPGKGLCGVPTIGITVYNVRLTGANIEVPVDNGTTIGRGIAGSAITIATTDLEYDPGTVLSGPVYLAHWVLAMSSIRLGSNSIFIATDTFRIEIVIDKPDMYRVFGADGRKGPFTFGNIIEQQFECAGRSLLLLTDDSPYEECLHILLLDENYGLLDSINIGAPYTPGILENVRPQQDRLTFEMYGYFWRMNIHHNAKLWPAFALPRGASRPLSRLLHRRYIEMQRTDNADH